MEGPRGFFGGVLVSNISSVNNLYTNIFKMGSLSKTDAGTAELLNNVFKAKSPYAYQNHDGDTLSLSSSGKEKQIMEDLSYLLQMLHDKDKVTPDQVAQNNASALEQTTSISVQTISIEFTSVQQAPVHSTSAMHTPLQMPDNVKKFLEAHTPDDLRKMSLDQIPDDVKDFAKEVASSRFRLHHRHHHPYKASGMNGWENPEEAAQNLVNSLFTDAGNQNSDANNDDLLKMVTEALEKTYEGLNKNAENLSQASRNNLNSVYVLAQEKITKWASVQGITIG